MDLNNKNFGITSKNLEKYERKVPVFSIFGQLDSEQLKQVDNDGYIKVKFLTKEQLDQVEEALSYDYHFSRIGLVSQEIKHKIYSSL